MKFLLIFTLFLLSLNLSFSQEHFHRGCATHTLDSILRAKNTTYDISRKSFEKNLQKTIKEKTAQRIANTEELIYTIPVVVHIIYNDEKSNIKDEEVFEQIEILNQDFRRLNIDAANTPNRWLPYAADIKIQFCLATRNPDGQAIDFAINRIKTTREEYHFERNNVELKSNSYWPSDQYLNIWVARLSDNILGYAQYPDGTELVGLSGNQGLEKTDGVVIDYHAFGLEQPAKNEYVNYPYIYGRTLTHEVGHWLGLFHTFGDDNGCGTTDYVNDTPRLGKNNQGLKNCNAIILGCGGDTAMYENYMDYTNDACMNLFTKGQKTRMRTAFLTSPHRVALLNSGGCCGSGVANFSPPYLQTFEDSIPIVHWDDSTYSSSFKWDIILNSFGHSAFAQSFSSDSASMLSPFFDLTTTKKPIVEFDISGTSISSSVSTVKIYYELTCSETWVELDNISSFDNNWNKYSYELPQLFGQKYVRFRLEAKTENGESVYLDNFKLYKSTEQLESTLYPNPSTDKVFLEINFSGKHPIKVAVYNTIGQLVKLFTTEDTNSTLLEFSFDELSVGTYFLKVEVNGETSVKKLLLSE